MISITIIDVFTFVVDGVFECTDQNGFSPNVKRVSNVKLMQLKMNTIVHFIPT